MKGSLILDYVHSHSHDSRYAFYSDMRRFHGSPPTILVSPSHQAGKTLKHLYWGRNFVRLTNVDMPEERPVHGSSNSIRGVLGEQNLAAIIALVEG